MNTIKTKSIIAIIAALILTGCASVPYEELRLDTTTNFRAPPTDRAGIYVYQHKTGILGAAMDVNFEIRGQQKIALNTGEFGYLEVPPGLYEYKTQGGVFRTFLPVRLEGGRNYFFRAFIFNLTDHAVLIRDQRDIDEAKENIRNGRYEPHDID